VWRRGRSVCWSNQLPRLRLASWYNDKGFRRAGGVESGTDLVVGAWSEPRAMMLWPDREEFPCLAETMVDAGKLELSESEMHQLVESDERERLY